SRRCAPIHLLPQGEKEKPHPVPTPQLLFWRQPPRKLPPNCARRENIDKKFRRHICILSLRVASAC
ncbi:hypothetical protein, partial [Mesorhizobium sp.]|uniref:hypothetical protein n=1 Tax=Mesorhizobium sp. TaxID=1871066 RepID=UPI0025F6DC73